MKSIQSKFMLLIISCIFLSTLIIGGAGILSSKEVIDHDSISIMNLSCKEQANLINAKLNGIKQAVKSLSTYTLDQIDNFELLENDQEYLAQFISKVEDVAVNLANNTPSSVSVYVRFNPNYWIPTEGFFYTRNAQDEFAPAPIVSLDEYSENDIGRVGWYYIPVNKGEATWIEPYHNENIDVYMISYVVPIYLEDKLVGVVGMDIDFDLLINSVANIKLYDSGYAFIVDVNGSVMYHKTIDDKKNLNMLGDDLKLVANELFQQSSSEGRLFDYTWEGVSKKMAYCSLDNNMQLVLSAPTSEIDYQKNNLFLHIVIAMALISLVFLFITYSLTGRIIRPLKELSVMAKLIATGDLSVVVPKTTNDEVGMLAESLQLTVDNLREHMDYIKNLAYLDALTGANNKLAYNTKVEQIESQIKAGNAAFGVIVFDINFLKQVNDNYGHEAGDYLIKKYFHAISESFKGQVIYRVGGDEFVSIIENFSKDKYILAKESLRAAIAKINADLPYDIPVDIAWGSCSFDKEIDKSYADVFKRADDSMYQTKIQMKQENNKPNK